MRSLRACGCVVERGKACPTHPPRPRLRPGTAARGYGGAHQRARAAGIEAAYGRLCARFGVDPLCPGSMERGQDLDLDHTDDRASYRGFAHAACNRRAGARARGR